jgi:polysaccharide export outer membrane protein
LRETIRARLAEQTLNPQVDVYPAEARGRVVSVQGRVRTPGLYPIEPPTERLLPMLARAGGVAEDPEVVRLRLRRGGTSADIWIQDLYDDPRNDVALRAGDALIAERDRRIFTALGSVGRQATVPFPSRELSVARAMGAVGGLLDATADPTGVFVFRQEQPEIAANVMPGTVGKGAGRIVYLIDLTRPGGMFLAREFTMRDGDTLYVTSAPFTSWMKVLQSVSSLVTFGGSARALTAY